MLKNRWIVVLAAGALTGALWAQNAPRSNDAAQQKATTRPSATPLPPEQMLEQMLRPQQQGPQARPVRPGTVSGQSVDRTSGAGAVAPDSRPKTVMREGSFIIDRVGRFTRSADGQQMEFAFESDGRTLQDPPVVLLPNLKLMMMENAVTGSHRDLRFRITGVVTEYKGRNYVLLDKVVVVQDEERQF
jgi:hypothetical protein